MGSISRLAGGLAAAVALMSAGAATAESGGLMGGYCGKVSLPGKPAFDTWILFFSDGGWTSPTREGHIGEGSYDLSGPRLTLSNDSGVYVQGNLVGDRFTGTVEDPAGRGTISFERITGRNGPVRSSPLPPDFEVGAAKDAIGGNRDGVAGAVTWSWTLQGLEYWQGISKGSGALPADATAALRDWVRSAEAGEKPACVTH